MNIIDYLTTPGNFVRTPDDRAACVLSFNATTNEVEVTIAATGFAEALNRGIGRHAQAQFENEMRESGVWRTYHFTKLRVGEDPNL